MKFSFIIAILLLLSGCKEIKIPDIGGLNEGLSLGKQVYGASEDITQEQEYYIGRSVAATVLGRYKLHKDPKLTEYVNSVGALLVVNSAQPEIYGGYHFSVLDSKEINAFATPGGFIFITKGLLKICKNEDELAAVLAHEISHVQLRHGVESIKDSRWTSITTTLGTQAAKKYGSKELAELTQTFEDSVDDIVKTLVVNGYSREYEYQADEYALGIMKKSDYVDAAMLTMLTKMQDRLKNDTQGFASTHPAPFERIELIRTMVKKGKASIPKVRKKRFLAYMKNV